MTEMAYVDRQAASGPAKSPRGNAVSGPLKASLAQTKARLDASPRRAALTEAQAALDGSAPVQRLAERPIPHRTGVPVSQNDGTRAMSDPVVQPVRQLATQTGSSAPVQRFEGELGELGNDNLATGFGWPLLSNIATGVGIGALVGQSMTEANLLYQATRGTRHGPEAGRLEGLSSYQTAPTPAGTLEGALPGQSRHKAVIKHVFGKAMPQNSGSRKRWRERQQAHIASLGTVGATADAKLKNDVFVANIMKNHDIMKTAARFAHKMSKVYGTGGGRAHVLAGHSAEMRHMWPDQNTSGTANSDYRGWQSVIGNYVGSYFRSRDPNPLATGLAANRKKLARLKKRRPDQPYTLEESSYILRAMGQLRDVMKTEKGRVPGAGGQGQVDGLIKSMLGNPTKMIGEDQINLRNRIIERGRGTGDHNVPAQHGQSRAFRNRFVQPLGTRMNQGTDIYRAHEPDGAASFDYLQGTSGTTLDMLNFFLAHNQDRETSTKLMQAFYANWHAVAPDGNAHSQNESMGTMLQYLYNTDLRRPIMAPILSRGDVDSMRGGEGPYGTALKDGESYLNYLQR